MPLQTPSADPNLNETKAHRDQRMKWWREARFGMFIHWGLYAQFEGTYEGKQTPGIGEWIMHDLKIPVADYAAYAKNFNPVQFDADKWVSIAKAAGMKYIVMTAKHHEGFPMYHTRTDGYNIFDATPFKREPIVEMAAACKRQHIKFGVYYSQAQDWHHAGGAAYGGHWDPAQDGDLHEYVKKIAAPQVEELITRIHPAVLWWDTPVDMSPEDIKELTAALPQDPELITNNRLGNGVPGDTETPEQEIPATGYNRDWETCMTINDTWGYKSFDTNFKSTETLLRNLIDIASKGGNYLLNVGPEPTGLIPQPEVDRLEQMGEWLKKNGRSIYGTTASPFKTLPFDGRATVKGGALYLNVFSWPEGGLTLPAYTKPIKSARVLATGEELAVTKREDGQLDIGKPSTLEPISTAIELK
jgi:alpha-L-fucosidase